MKKTIQLFAFILLMTFSLQSQAQTKFGVKAGLNYSNIKQNLKDTDDEFKTKGRALFHIGVAAEMGLTEALSLQTGLIYSMKGWADDLQDDVAVGTTVTGSSKVSISYIEVPIHFAYKMNDFQIYAGPYVAMGIGGKYKEDYEVKNDLINFTVDEKRDMKPKFGEVSLEDQEKEKTLFYSALDYGLDFGVGYQVGPILINAGYSLGLGNFTPKTKDGDRKDYKLSNNVISLSATYFFGGE